MLVGCAVVIAGCASGHTHFAASTVGKSSLAGTSMPGSASSDGQTAFLASDSSYALLIRWTKTGHNLSGTIDASGLDRDVTGGQAQITGTANGSDVSLSVDGQSWTGSVAGGTLTLHVPQSDGSLQTFVLRPGDIDAYNSAVAGLHDQAQANANAAAVAQAAAQAQQARDAADGAVTSADQQVTGDMQQLAADFAALRHDSTLTADTSSAAGDLKTEQADFASEQADDRGSTPDCGQVGSDDGSVGSDDGAVQSDQGSLESDSGGIGSDISNVQNDLDALAGDAQSLTQALAADGGRTASVNNTSNIARARGSALASITAAHTVQKTAAAKMASIVAAADALVTKADAIYAACNS
jgi:hypothetical protein